MKRPATAGALAAVLLAVLAMWWSTMRRPEASLDARKQEPAERPRSREQGAAVTALGPAHAQGSTPGVTGSVRAATGEPIAGAGVCASCAYPQCGEPGPPRMRCATTAADGRYALGELVVGLRYRMLATAADYRPAAPVEGGQRNPWLLLTDESPRQIDFVLERGGARIAGTVLDAFGGPIAGAVVAAAEERDGLGGTTFSDEGGRFALPLEEGSWNVRASAAGYDSSQVQLLAPSEDVQLVLAAAGGIRGRVVSAVDGAPVPGVEVRATQYARVTLGPGDGSATSDAAGHFAIEGLGAGDYELTARGQRWYGSAPGRRHLAIGEHATAIEIRVRPAVTVEGRVVLDPGGEPCASGSVQFATAVVADSTGDGFAALAPIAGGAVAIEGVPAGEYRVMISCPGYLARPEYDRVRVASADVRGLRWPVTRGLRVAGQLIDASGRGVGARVIQATPEAGADGHAQAVTSATGDFELLALAATRYRIAATDAAESAQTIDLSAGKPLSSPLRLQLRAAGTLEVQVLPATAAATAVVQALGADVQRTALRVAADRFELRDLPAGAYRVYASDGRNRPVEGSATVAAGAQTRVSLAVPSAEAVLRGQVLDRDGMPVADAAVTAVPSRVPALPGPDLKSAVLTQVDGTFVIPNLIAGDPYNLQVEHQDGSASELGAVPGNAVLLRLTGPS